jgi:hypothetical protein
MRKGPSLGDTKYVSRRRLQDNRINHLVRDTRIRVRWIIDCHLKGFAVEEIQGVYPELSTRQIQAALRFWRDHPEEFRKA